ncbi:PepSY domain-containing protein [Agrobacterium rubi]|nr:PepSY domain-containing protein [Agrobacterium rubi]NTF23930.1 PepSY domain-containing protein [Agrobacterium rubi]
MKTYLLAAALICGSAFHASAQTAPTTEGNTPVVATPTTVNPTAPVVGANSFTEVQAQERIAAAGYTAIEDLKLDDNGIWQAKATMGGKSALVSLDYQGNIVAE